MKRSSSSSLVRSPWHSSPPGSRTQLWSAQTASIIDVSSSSVYVIFLPNLSGRQNTTGVRKPDARWQSCSAAGMRTEKKAVGVLKTKCWLAGGRTAGRSEQHSYCLGRHLRPDRDYDGQCGMNGRVARYEANSQYEYWQVIRTRPEPLTAGLCDAILRDGPAEPPGCRRCTVRDISDIKTEIISLMFKVN